MNTSKTLQLIRGLSESEIALVREKTELLLERTGFVVGHEEILRTARRAGARVDETAQRVRVPSGLLRELLALAPRTYTIRGSDGAETRIGEDRPACTAIVTDPWIVDYRSGELRKPCREDVRRHTVIAQRLPEVRAISRMDYPVSDIPGPTSSLQALEIHLLNHAKHCHVMPASLESMRQWLAIGEILSGGKGLAGSRLLTLGIGVISPLTISRMNCELLLAACRYDFPIVPTVCPMAGSTSPYSSAGTLLVANAECVIVAALAQMIRPGAPVQYVFGPSLTDLRTGHDLYYPLDKAVWKLAGVQLARSYGLPAGAECGGAMTRRYDLQTGAEGMLFMLSAWGSGADVLAGIGSCCNAVTMSAEMMIVHAAWLDAARHMARGLRIDEESLAVDAIERVGPGGAFLADESTVELLRSSGFFANPFFDLAGEREGGTPLLEAAHAKAEELGAQSPSPLPEDVQEGLRRFFRDEYGASAR